MKRVYSILLLVLISFSSVFAMKKTQPKRQKEYSQELLVNLPLNQYDPNKENLRKKVVVVTPEATSQAKAETYFRKNANGIQDRVRPFLGLCTRLMYSNDAPLAWSKEELCALVNNPLSKFIYKDGCPNMYLESPLGSNGEWHFTQIAEFTLTDAASQKGICHAMVQCHHEAAKVHDKIYVSELERMYKESGASDKALDASLELRLITLATLCLEKHPNHKHLFQQNPILKE